MTNPSKNLIAAFKDPAHRAFRKIWRREADIAADLEMGCAEYARWSQDRAACAAERDSGREKFCQEMAGFWDRYLVKAAERLARHKAFIAAGKNRRAAAFAREKLSTLEPVYEALAALDDARIKSGKAIFDALQPLLEPAPGPGPLGKSNASRTGPVT